MGNKASDLNSSEDFSNNITSVKSLKPAQFGGNNHGSDLDLSFLDSDGDYENYQQGGNSNLNTNLDSDLNSDTETFLNQLKEKISNINVGSNNQNAKFSDTSDMSDTSGLSATSENAMTDSFLPSRQTAQTGGSRKNKKNETDSDLNGIMDIAREYLKQHGGGSDDSAEEDDEDSDEELDDSDEEDSESSAKKPAKRSTHSKPSNQSQAQAKSSNQAQAHSSKQVQSLNKASKAKQQELSESISSEQMSSDKYSTDSSESYGSSVSSKSETPYLQESDSVNTSSINLVSFDNSNVQQAKKSKKSKTAKRHSKY